MSLDERYRSVADPGDQIDGLVILFVLGEVRS
jgi:hypothetical protein